jgi:hypothetical protein
MISTLGGSLSRGQALMISWICSSDRKVGVVDTSAIRRWVGIMVCGSSSRGSMGANSALCDRASAAPFWLLGW